jgi:hypothetical protein
VPRAGFKHSTDGDVTLTFPFFLFDDVFSIAKFRKSRKNLALIIFDM